MSDTDGTLLQAALAYADRGWPVIPLKPRSKLPATKNGSVDGGRFTPDLVNAWWHLNPDANIGLATGIVFDVIDIDGPEAREVVDELWPNWIREAPVVRTGRGYHVYLAITGRANSADPTRKLDFRGHHGYVLAPPSRHPEGHLYRWLNEPARIPVAPRHMIEALGRPVTTTTAQEIVDRRTEDAAYTLTELIDRKYGPRPWRRKGLNRVTNCPLGTHPDHMQSFTVYPDQHAYCFGCQTYFGAARFARGVDPTP